MLHETISDFSPTRPHIQLLVSVCRLGQLLEGFDVNTDERKEEFSDDGHKNESYSNVHQMLFDEPNTSKSSAVLDKKDLDTIDGLVYIMQMT